MGGNIAIVQAGAAPEKIAPVCFGRRQQHDCANGNAGLETGDDFLIGRAGFEQAHAHIRIGGEAIRHNAAARTRPNNDVVEFPCVHPAPSCPIVLLHVL